MPMAAFQQLVKLLPAVAGGELLKIDGGGAVGDVGNAGVCNSKHLTDRIAHIPKVTTFGPPRRGPRPPIAHQRKILSSKSQAAGVY